MTLPTDEQVEAAKAAVLEARLPDGLPLSEWLCTPDQQGCPSLGITWPEHPHDRHVIVGDDFLNIVADTVARAVLTAALPLALADAAEALEPFARMADQVDKWAAGTDPNHEAAFDANDLRRARAVRARLIAGADGWQTMETAPRDGTHILAVLSREASEDMDGAWWPAHHELREIWYRPYRQLGMDLPWHAGDPFDLPSREHGSDHFGDAVPTAWRPLPSPPRASGG